MGVEELQATALRSRPIRAEVQGVSDATSRCRVVVGAEEMAAPVAGELPIDAPDVGLATDMAHQAQQVLAAQRPVDLGENWIGELTGVTTIHQCIPLKQVLEAALGLGGDMGLEGCPSGRIDPLHGLGVEGAMLAG